MVIICGKKTPDQKVPRIHAAYEPTKDIYVGEEIVFKVRSMNTPPVDEEICFGDKSPIKKFQSDGNIVFKNPNGYAVLKHRYREPGDYIVTVRRSDPFGQKAIAHLHVKIK